MRQNNLRAKNSVKMYKILEDREISGM